MHIHASLQKISVLQDPLALAEDYSSKFKDNFSKSVEVFFKQSIGNDYSHQDAVFLNTEFGNTENIVRLINDYENKPYVSAQLFPEATMCSASVNLNRALKIKGSNITANSNTSLNDAILLCMIDATEHQRAVHFVYGEVNQLAVPNTHANFLIYMKFEPSDTPSYFNFPECDPQSQKTPYYKLSDRLKENMDDDLFQYIRNCNHRGMVSDVYIGA